jgi:hypothetical protein
LAARRNEFLLSVQTPSEFAKVADLGVLGRDPLKEKPSTLLSIPVERTMAGGRWTFEA